jgi:aryl-alcohol dehydrogenase-like predicted oxidoreductase
VHLLQLHNPLALASQPDPGWLPVERLPEVCAVFESLARQGKARYWGLTGLGEAEALHRAVSAGGFHSLQVVYNLLNPSAGRPVPAGFPYPDYGQILDRAAGAGIGTIAIRTLAGGALSGATVRHPVAAPTVRPLVTGPHYAADVAAAARFGFLVRQGIAESLVEAALRFAISKPELSVAMLGISSPEQLEAAVAAVNRGPLPADVLARL